MEKEITKVEMIHARIRTLVPLSAPSFLWTLVLLGLAKIAHYDEVLFFRNILTEMASPNNTGLILFIQLNGAALYVYIFGNYVWSEHDDNDKFAPFKQFSKRWLVEHTDTLLRNTLPAYLGMMLGTIIATPFMGKFYAVLLLGPAILVGCDLMSGAITAFLTPTTEKNFHPLVPRFAAGGIVLLGLWFFCSGQLFLSFH
ncbi:hypothetical protein [Geomonas subterranea]|uniref:hypothetical protein n=1 Tax=Geomonas subterranea TaxID=2847989 RepID=UPI001CD39400|nr:hypothetical protein [Geomonas fuzhouensis]